MDRVTAITKSEALQTLIGSVYKLKSSTSNDSTIEIIKIDINEIQPDVYKLWVWYLVTKKQIVVDEDYDEFLRRYQILS